MRENPLFLTSIALLIGLFLAFYELTIFFSPFIFLLAFLYLKRKAFLLFSAALILFSFYGYLHFSDIYFSKKQISHKEEKIIKLTVKILKVEPFYETCKVLALNKSFEEIEFNSKTACQWKPGHNCELFLKVKRGYHNPYTPAPKERLITKGISGEYIHVEKLTTYCVSGEASFQERLRSRLFDFSQSLSPLAKGLFQALVLGVENQLPREYLETLKSQGLYHQLAISGFNLAVLYGLLYKTAKFLLGYTTITRFGLPLQIWASLMALPGAGLILVLSGFQPPTVRAFFFLILLLFGRLLYRNTPSLLVLLLTGSFLVLLSPELVGNLSFQLSFVATFALLLGDWIWRGRLFKWDPYEKDFFGKRFSEKLIFALFVSMLVSLFTFPFILGISGEIPLATPINNLIAGPFWSFLFIPGAIVSSLLALINEPLARLFMEGLSGIFSLYMKIPLFTFKFSPSIPLNLFLLFLFVISFIGLLLWRICSRRLWCLVMILLLIFGLYSLLNNLYKRVNYLIIPKFPQNRAILIKERESFYLLVQLKSGSYLSRELFPLLKKLGVKRLDRVFLWRETAEEDISNLERELRKHFDLGLIYQNEDLELDFSLRLLASGKEIIPLGENSFLVEFMGLTLQVMRGSPKKGTVMPYVEVLLAERISPSISYSDALIFAERERKSALYFIATESGAFYYLSEEDRMKDLLRRLFFPLFTNLGSEEPKDIIILKRDFP